MTDMVKNLLRAKFLRSRAGTRDYIQRGVHEEIQCSGRRAAFIFVERKEKINSLPTPCPVFEHYIPID